MSGQLSPRIPNTRLQFVGVACILAFVFLVTVYFSGSKTKKVHLPSVPEGPPLTGVYLCFPKATHCRHVKTGDCVGKGLGVFPKFDSSKYTNPDGTVFIPEDDVLYKMSVAELEELYHRFQENLQTACRLQLHVGDEVDGGYHICETAVKKNTCRAYSFGTQKEFSFDDGLVSLFGCKVHSFVPADGEDNHKHSDGVTFHQLGLGGRDEHIKADTRVRAKIYTLASLRSMLGEENTPIDILKINIGGGEWLTLRQMLDAKTLQQAQVKTLIVNFSTVNEKRDSNSYIYMLKLLRELNDLGYRRYFFRMWWKNCIIKDLSTQLERTGCHEVHFLKV